MKLVEMNWNPTDRQLRQFGAVAWIAIPVLGWFWGAGLATLLVLAGAGAAVALLAWVFPAVLKPGFVGLSVAALPIGMAVSELALLCVYCLLFVPMGLCFRLIGRDALRLRFDRRAATYWEPKQQPSGPESYFHPW